VTDESKNITEKFVPFLPNEDAEYEEVQEYKVVDNERSYMLSFIKKNRKITNMVKDEKQIRN